MPTGFERKEIEGSIGARLRKLAVQIPRQEAVRRGSTSITFSELNSISDRVARYLLARLGPSPEPVAVLAEQGVPSLIAMFGVVKAGKCYSIFPPQFPQERLDARWNDLHRPPVISNANHHDLALALCKDPGLVLDIDAASGSECSTELPAIPADTLGSIAYTSATTGDPKGVMCSHRMILHLGWQNGDLYRISPRDRLAHLSAYGFGAADTATFSAILNGAVLCLPEEKTDHLQSILSWLRKNQISILSLTAFGLFRQQAASGRKLRIPLPELRLVLLGGEDLFRPDLDVFWKIFPKHTALSYRLAGSETNLMRENRIERQTILPAGKIPVGYAVPDKELLLLDENHYPVPSGQIGEIAIHSRYLASGYWQRPDLYAEKFQSNTSQPDVKTYLSGDIGCLNSDGQLKYLGRKDNVVKIRGFGIQLEDVERALQLIKGIKECSATALSLPSGDKRLAAYIVRDPGASLAVEDLRRELVITLPRFMIPSVFVFLDRLPRTATGKVERSKLPEPDTIRPPLRTPYAPAASDMEKQLCAIWADLLRIDSVGIQDDFFDLGGDSLLALHLSFKIEETFHQAIPSQFFRKPTVSALAGLLETGTLPSEKRQGRRKLTSTRRGGRMLRRSSRLALPIFHRGRKPNLVQKALRNPSSLLRIFLSAVAIHLPYRQGSQWAAWFPFQAWARTLFYKDQIELFHQLVRDLGGIPEAPECALEIFLAGNLLWSRFARLGIHPDKGRNYIDQLRGASNRYWKDLARLIEKAPDDEFNRFFTVSGLEFFEQAFARGKGVIITTYHNTANRISIAALTRRLHCDPIPTISALRAFQVESARRRSEHDESHSADEQGLMADLTLEGKRLLGEGKIIQIVPDQSFDIVGNRPLEIGGRRYHIKPGLAEYALLTGAAIIPQFSTRRVDGSVHMAFQPPIEIPAGMTDREEQVYFILRQYASFVDRSWRLAPEALNWVSIKKMLRKPRVLPASESGVEEGIQPPDPGKQSGS
jgi:acyl-coenzyme A synthetase/AMP-(fatty) acid ligase/lauroyl/myristoyl acyltransferase/acyl carrier protein